MWLSSKNLKLGRPSNTLTERQLGPYPISRIISPNAVELKLPKAMKIHPVVNVSRVRPAKESTIEGQKSKPAPPVVIEGEQEWEVEEILDSRHRRNQLQYLVKWKGFTSEHNTWEPKDNVKNAPDKIKVFYKKNSGAVRTIRKEVFESLPWRPIENYTNGDQDRKKVLFNWLDTHLEDEP